MPDVRLATPADAAAIAAVQLAAWQVVEQERLPVELLTTPVAELGEAWERSLEAPAEGFDVLVATEADEVVGLLVRHPGGEIAALHVHPGRARQGHGSRLLHAAVTAWRLAGVAEVSAWVWADDSAVGGLLAAAGFEPAEQRELDTGRGVFGQRCWRASTG